MRPHAFLFNGDDRAVVAASGDTIWHHLFDAILRLLPGGKFDVRAGDILLSHFSYRMIGVETGVLATRSPMTRTFAKHWLWSSPNAQVVSGRELVHAISPLRCFNILSSASRSRMSTPPSGRWS